MKRTQKLFANSIFLLNLLFATQTICAQKVSVKQEDSKDKVFKPICTEVNLAEEKPSWITVLGGSILSNPVRNAAGFVAPVEGKMIYCFNQEGKVIWKHGIPQTPTMFTSGSGGMLYCVSRGEQISMINPSGLQLWSKKAGFTIEGEPYNGYDGRVFVRNSTNLSCYGLKGVRRWKIEIPDQNTNIPLVELNDGTLLVFLNKTQDSKSIAYTVSPFSTIGEEIVFSGVVCKAKTCDAGALLSFTDGSIGLCASGKNGAYSKWIIPGGKTGISATNEIVTNAFSEKYAAFISGSKILLVEIATGTIISSFNSVVNASSLSYCGMTSQGLVLADNLHAECFDKDGNPLWRVTFASNKKWKYLFPTDSGYLVFCDESWAISSYKIKEPLSFSNSYKETVAKPYTLLYDQTEMVSTAVVGRAISSVKSSEMQRGFKYGDFGEYEKSWISLLNNEMSALCLDWTTKKDSQYAKQNAYFTINHPYSQEIINLAASSGTALFQSYFATLLKSTKDKTFLVRLVKNAGVMAYDPNALMLSAIEQLLKNPDISKHDDLCFAICDAVYEICRFMGRPAFFERGSGMLSFLLYPHFSLSVQNYAKATMKRIIESKL